MSGKGLLKGCAIGCGGLIVLMIIGMVMLTMWANQKGEFEESTSILTDDVDMFIRTNLVSDDEVLVNFVLSAFESNQERYNSNSPGFLADIQKWKTEKDLRKMLPLEIEISGLPDTNDYRASIGFTVNNNLARLAFVFIRRAARDEGKTYEHNGTTVLFEDQNATHIYGTLSDNIIYAATNRNGINASLDIKDQIADHSVDSRLTGLDLTRPIYGFLTGSATDLAWLRALEEKGVVSLDLNNPSSHETAEDGPDSVEKAMTLFLQEASRVAYDMAITSENQLGGVVLIDHPRAGPETETILRDWLAAWKPELEITTEVETTNGVGFKINYTVSGFDKLATEY